MNIDKIIADELRSNYLNKVEKALKILGLTFSDLKRCVRVGRSKSGIAKGHHPKYSSTKHKVISIKDNDYLIDIMNKQKLYHRHEMLLVK